MKKETALAVAPTQEALAELQSLYPVEQGFTRILLPRLSLISQDVTEEIKNKKTGKKEINIITEAGTFLTEVQTDEKDEEDKNIWNREEQGTEVEATVIFSRHQLKFYDGEKYTSSPVYDNVDEVVPLFKDKVEVDRGTPAELQARPQYQGKSAKGKDISKLEDTRVLYVLYKGEVYQMSLRGSSMYSFLTYARKTLVPSVLTRFSSESKENGSIAWNQMTCETVRPLNGEEVNLVLEKVREIKEGILAEKAYYSKPEEKKEDDFSNTAWGDSK